MSEKMQEKRISLTGPTERRGSRTDSIRSHHSHRHSHERVSDPAADVALARMGYEAELQRNMSMFSVMGL